MKLGVFSDLHSNIYALKAMLRAATDVEQWIGLGDSVGLFPGVNEVLDWFRAREVLAIRGNHEACLMEGGRLIDSFSGNESLDLQRRVISEVNAAYLRALRPSLTTTIGGRAIRAVHALSDHGGAGGEKYRIDLKVVTEAFPGTDIVLFGNTHLPLSCHCRTLLLLNPGSCGFPIDVTRRPSFAVVETADLSSDLRRFDYEKQPLIDDIRRHGYNPALARFVETGTWRG